jgi:uncharacterized protein YprB with RNaseH-like and TPR domain
MRNSGITLHSVTISADEVCGMSKLDPIAFDIETSGLDEDAILTVAGLCTDVGAWQGLNTAGRTADRDDVEATVREAAGSVVNIEIFQDEAGLLAGLKSTAGTLINEDRHYLTAYFGETWNDGFDLPFLRRVCVRHDHPWPFPKVAYADTLSVISRVETGDSNGLAGVYESLIGADNCDPFEDSDAAVTAHEDGEWTNLLLHNLADIQRTRELAVLAGRYVPRSDFKMKNLHPPG